MQGSRCVRDPGLRAEYIRPLFCEGKGPFRWVALSGDPEDIRDTDARCSNCSRTTGRSNRWCGWRANAYSFRACRRASAGSATESAHRPGWVQRAGPSGRSKAPIVIGRDHLDTGSVARRARNRSHAGRLRRGGGLADPQRAAEHGQRGELGLVSPRGRRRDGEVAHAGQVTVADGTPESDERIRRVLLADPGLGVLRHADAGYPEASEAAQRGGLRVPMAAMPAESVCLTGAAQVLRPPEDGLPFVRGDRAAELRLDPVAVTIAGGEIAAFEEAEAELRVDASGCAVVPGFVDCHTAPAVRRLAGGGVRAQGHRREVRGDRPRGRRDRLLGASLRRGNRRRGSRPGAVAGGRCWPGERRPSRQERLRAVRWTGSFARCASPASSMVRCGRHHLDRLVAHAVPPGYTADSWMDEVGRWCRG